MRALSVRQPYAQLIASGEKNIEYRSRKVDFRGPLLIVASASRHDDDCEEEGLDPDALEYGAAICVVELVKVTGSEGDYKWHLREPKRVKPVPIRGYAAIYNVDDDLIELADDDDGSAPVSGSHAHTRSRGRTKLPLPIPGTPVRHSPYRGRGAPPSLLPHQELAVRAIEGWLREPQKNAAAYLDMPTGSGKTFTAATGLRMILEAGFGILWIAHNDYLLRQAQQTMLRRYGPQLEAHIAPLTGRSKRFDGQITLASVQTLSTNSLAHLERLVRDNRPAVAVFDEFHRSAADSWKHVVTWLSKCEIPILGLSATPTRTGASKRGWLEKAFPHRLFRVGITELIDQRVLARPQVFRVDVKGKKLRWSADELAQFKKFGEVPESLLKRLATQEERNKAVVQAYLNRRGLGRTIIFCCSVDHAAHLAERLQKQGVKARAVTGSAADKENAEALVAFQAGALDVLTSVVLLTEGVDLPACSTVLLARPTQSEILLKQMIGRALRGPLTGGSERCTVIDFVDAFENISDISGTSKAFVREFDTGLTPILSKKPTGSDRSGLDFAALLRLRDWLAQQPEGADRAVFLREIEGVLEFFDGAAGVNRAVLVPRSDKEAVRLAAKEVTRRLRAAPELAQSPVGTAIVTRSVYADCLSATKVPEEDFVAVVGEASRQGKMVFRPAEELVGALAQSATLRDSTLERIEGIERILDLLKS